jgi:hypothetical protein
MFIKRTHSKNFTYLSIAETYRDGGKVKHRIIAPLGREDELKKDLTLERLVSSIMRVSGVELPTPTGQADNADELVSLKDISEKSRRIWGPVKVYRKIWDELGLSTILGDTCRSAQRDFDIAETTFLISLSRLMRPSSKLKVYQQQERYLGIDPTKLHHLYRALDHLAAAKEKIEGAVYERQRDLFSLTIDVVFYDVTTLHFESVQSDELRNFGYSKDAKFGEVQVVVGLLVDTEGRPVGFDVYPGNTFEGHTLKSALTKLKKRFNIGKVIVVADRGINSKINLNCIKEMGYDYIVGSRLRNLPKSYHKEIQNRHDYEPFSEGADDTTERSLYKIIQYDNKVVVEDDLGNKSSKCLKEIILCTWSPTRARKDSFDRERLIKKAHDLVASPSKIYTKKGSRRFINADTPDKLSIDQNRIAEKMQSGTASMAYSHPILNFLTVKFCTPTTLFGK